MRVHSDETIAEYESAGVWGDETLFDTLGDTIDAHPERTAVVDPPDAEAVIGRPPVELTYQELDSAIDAVARALSGAGVSRDDVVVFQLPNTWELVVLLLAVNKMGGIGSPVPVEWRRRELTHVLDHTDAVLYIGAPAHDKTPSMDLVSDVCTTVAGDEFGAIDMRTAEWVRNARHQNVEPSVPETSVVGANEVFNLQWTSGTTADPKACPMTHNNWQCNQAPALCDIDAGDTILGTPPLVNMTGIGVTVIPWLLTRGTLRLHHPLDLDLLIKQLESGTVDFTILVPTVLNRILKHEEVDSFDFTGVDTIVTGSAAPAEWVLQEFTDRWDIDITNIWGQNEGTWIVSAPRTTPLERRHTDFPLLSPDRNWGIDHPPTANHTEVKLVDPSTGDPIDPESAGIVGELAFRGPITMAGYYRDPDRTDEAFDEDGYFLTGDLFETTGEGYVRFVDRKKDVIVRGGHTISAKEVENCAISHPAIEDAAAVGIPDPDLGERTCLFVVPAGGTRPTLAEIQAHLDETLARYKWPERLECVEEIPRNPVGKVCKAKLRDQIKAVAPSSS